MGISGTLKVLLLAFETEFMSDTRTFGGSKRAEYTCMTINLIGCVRDAKKDCRSQKKIYTEIWAETESGEKENVGVIPDTKNLEKKNSHRFFFVIKQPCAEQRSNFTKH